MGFEKRSIGSSEKIQRGFPIPVWTFLFCQKRHTWLSFVWQHKIRLKFFSFFALSTKICMCFSVKLSIFGLEKPSQLQWRRGSGDDCFQDSLYQYSSYLKIDFWIEAHYERSCIVSQSLFRQDVARRFDIPKTKNTASRYQFKIRERFRGGSDGPTSLDQCSALENILLPLLLNVTD